MRNHEDHIKVGYADDSPYPEIKVLEKNSYYAELLMDNYAGMVSEFTAINQYLYHYFVNEKEDEEVVEMLENISITEMLHMEILAKLITLLGTKPVYRCGRSSTINFWRGDFVYYGCNMCDQLKANLNAEIKAIKSYEHHIDIIKDPYIKDILKRIILDEEVHVKLFKKALEKYSK